MKKRSITLSCCLSLLLLTSCGSTEDAQREILEELAPGSTSNTMTHDLFPDMSNVNLSTTDGIDVDLAQLTTNMTYAQIYQMQFYPDDYEGKIIRIFGQFFVYVHPDTGQEYYTIMVIDATGCCIQGIEFVLKDGLEYPPIDTYVMIQGEFQTYQEEGYTYFHLADAEYSQTLNS